MCSSNWLAGQASIVQWPELCGRGAISFTSTRPLLSTNISTASNPTRSSASAIRLAMACAASVDCLGDRRRGKRQIEDVVAMAVLDGVESGEGAILATRHDHADLLGEIDETFQDQRLRSTEGRKPAARSLGLAEQRLALAVVAQPRGLQDRRQADAGRPPRPGRRGFPPTATARWHARAVQEGLLRDPVLTDAQDRWARAGPASARQEDQDLRR